MFKRIDLNIRFPNEIMVHDIKIPRDYNTHIYSNMEQTNIEGSYNQLVMFFKTYGQFVEDYAFYTENKDGSLTELNKHKMGKLLSTPTTDDVLIHCFYTRTH